MWSEEERISIKSTTRYSSIRKTTIRFSREFSTGSWRSTLGEAGADFDQSGTIDTNEYLTLTYKHLSTSKEIDGVVLLGLDALYGPRSGKLDKRKTDLWVSNRFLAKKVKELNDRLMREDDPRKEKRNSIGVHP